MFNVYIESLHNVCPVKGMHLSGKNGCYFVYKSDKRYSELMAGILKKQLDKKPRDQIVNCFYKKG
jgi:hypothetical protein